MSGGGLDAAFSQPGGTATDDMPQLHVSAEVAEGLIVAGWQEDLADRSNDGRWDFECLLDDFIVLSFLAGNDFLPASPSIDICSGWHIVSV